ncbi:hypothetical protein GDO86_007404 [Hymenochirus boettgeri]|uniref:CRIB domain-containing protein n=1 Tax=Hymenochirus boettgeri TaxID=247094 RepID=A0A8T2J0S5_9PIPI|nr:hypothetical protein GDO86_007404 [Hymenochirus boettgeri]
MSFGNLPVIKSLVSRSRREQRVELTTDMISHPMGDFRHIMHVGRKGEVFGDTTFLSQCQDRQRHNRWNYIRKKLHQAGWMPSEHLPPRGQGDATLIPPPDVSPIIKNAVSLPLLTKYSWDQEKKCDTAKMRNFISEARSPYGLESGMYTLPRLSSSRMQPEEANSEKAEEEWSSIGLADDEDCSVCTVPVELSSSLWRSNSIESFTMDFGPSLMSEVLEVISFSNTPQEKGANGRDVPEEQESFLACNANDSSLNVTMDNSECESIHIISDLEQTKEIKPWAQVISHGKEEMDTEVDSEHTESEHSSRCANMELWDSGDGSEIEM